MAPMKKCSRAFILLYFDFWVGFAPFRAPRERRKTRVFRYLVVEPQNQRKRVAFSQLGSSAGEAAGMKKKAPQKAKKAERLYTAVIKSATAVSIKYNNFWIQLYGKFLPRYDFSFFLRFLTAEISNFWALDLLVMSTNTNSAGWLGAGTASWH